MEQASTCPGRMLRLPSDDEDFSGLSKVDSRPSDPNAKDDTAGADVTMDDVTEGEVQSS